PAGPHRPPGPPYPAPTPPPGFAAAQPGLQRVARMERSDIRGRPTPAPTPSLGFAAAQPGLRLQRVARIERSEIRVALGGLALKHGQLPPEFRCRWNVFLHRDARGSNLADANRSHRGVAGRHEENMALAAIHDRCGRGVA